MTTKREPDYFYTAPADAVTAEMRRRFEEFRDEIDLYANSQNLRRILANYVFYYLVYDLIRITKQLSPGGDALRSFENVLHTIKNVFLKLSTDEFRIDCTGPEVTIEAPSEEERDSLLNFINYLEMVINDECPQRIPGMDIALGWSLIDSYGVRGQSLDELVNYLEFVDPRLKTFLALDQCNLRRDVPQKDNQDHTCGVWCLAEILGEFGGFSGALPNQTPKRKDN